MAWIVAFVNVASFLIAGIGAVALAFRYKRWHWLAIAIAVLMTVMPTIVDSASSGKTPFAPYDEAVPVPPGSDAVKITKTFTPWSYLATAVALLAVVAIKDEKRKANQIAHPTTL
ncbi:MAG: hypothetical protein IPL39_12345 [Opitutaceae bacterium]|nr:hypothetical protein [Opitutaceae bacterium]